MHDQKLTEDTLPINQPGFTGYENIYDMKQGLYCRFCGGCHAEFLCWKKAEFLGGTGSEPKGDNGQWMWKNRQMGFDRMKMDYFDRMAAELTFGKNYVAPAIMSWNSPEAIAMRKKYEMPNADRFYKDFWEAEEKRLLKPIDHPYLLPPASGILSHRDSNGVLWSHITPSIRK